MPNNHICTITTITQNLAKYWVLGPSRLGSGFPRVSYHRIWGSGFMGLGVQSLGFGASGSGRRASELRVQGF